MVSTFLIFQVIIVSSNFQNNLKKVNFYSKPVFKQTDFVLIQKNIICEDLKLYTTIFIKNNINTNTNNKIIYLIIFYLVSIVNIYLHMNFFKMISSYLYLKNIKTVLHVL